MRCRPDDIVQVIRSVAGNEGRVGTVERWVTRGDIIAPDFATARDGWLVLGHFEALNFDRSRAKSFPFGVFPDEHLRPIRGLPGADEMLRIAGHPLSQSHREGQPA